jgi:glutamate racemase
VKKDLAIGVFDSGIGGLTVVSELFRQLPGEKIVYFGDTARTPYGNKSPENLIRFSLENAGFLTRQNIKMLVVACNSSSAYSLQALRKNFNIPVIGVIEPGARAAVENGGKKIGIIGTLATIVSQAYQKAVKQLAPETKVYTRACPLFVPLVEEGWLDHPVTFKVASQYLADLKAKKINTLVLGCTHYPLIKPVIARVMGKSTLLVDSACETACEVKRILQSKDLLSDKKKCLAKEHKFYVSDLADRFKINAKKFLGSSLLKVTQVNAVEFLGYDRRTR